MKNRLMKAIIAVAAFVVIPQMHAYQYSFSNHTNKKMAVAIRFKTSKWYEFCVVQPGTMCSIAHGNRYVPDMQTDFPSASAGLIPSQLFYYIPKPGEKMTTSNQQTVGWRAINITWVPTEAYDISIKLAGKFGKFGEAAGKTAAKAGAAYMTGGASDIADEAKEAAKALSAKNQKGKADALEKVAEGEYGLGKLLSTIGESAVRSLIGNHHFDIVEDENGKISFISLL